MDAYVGTFRSFGVHRLHKPRSAREHGASRGKATNRARSARVCVTILEMPTTFSPDSLQAQFAPLNNPLQFSAFLEKLAPKDRPKVEKQMAEFEAAGDMMHVELWKRLACSLLTLSPHQPKVNKTSIQFYEADGRHKKQLLAMEDPGEGKLVIYCKDVIDHAIQGGLLQRDDQAGTEQTLYPVVGSSITLSIERIDGAVINPQEFFKHLVGWNRKALRITLPINASEPQIVTVERLCAMSVTLSEPKAQLSA